MEEILEYKNRERLYDFLLDKFGFIKLDERYDGKSFGNFYIVLSSKQFLLRYIKDRSFLTIEIAGHLDLSEWLDLSYIKNYLFNPGDINPDASSIDNNTRILELNKFLKNDFESISDLMTKEHYRNTWKSIKQLLKEQHYRDNPGIV
jgi:hypothetical protein